ncbi:MAG: dephospho-CoA kinase [Lachnospiraceae bacterium]|nr:dephospho-CoA kinase [Lachnospiraceae bacterium]MDY4971716.1 dephospho-CoA kinase [Lachnospiraceae bacterium]
MEKLVIGITGGVGAGKSTVLNILQKEYQAEIILTDQVAHELMQPGTSCYEEIVKVLGTEILAEDGTFDKVKLGNLMFNDKNTVAMVNQIVHPAVRKETAARIEASRKKLIVIESALLIEANFKPLCDEIWYVYVSTQERVKRLYEQRGYSEVKSYSIIYNQLSHEQFRRNCDRLVDNGASREYTRRQIREFMKEITERMSGKEQISEEESGDGQA